jgi:large subunit ribosomal protein L29
MAHLKTKELRNLTSDELKEKLEGLKKELFSLRVQAKLGKLEKHSSVHMTKRDIARVNTLMREKESS